MSDGKHWKHQDYSLDTYVAYTKSVAVAMERRLLDLKPRRPAVYWRWFHEEVAIAQHRMRTVSGEIRKLSSTELS